MVIVLITDLIYLPNRYKLFFLTRAISTYTATTKKYKNKSTLGNNYTTKNTSWIHSYKLNKLLAYSLDFIDYLLLARAACISFGRALCGQESTFCATSNEQYFIEPLG